MFLVRQVHEMYGLFQRRFMMEQLIDMMIFVSERFDIFFQVLDVMQQELGIQKFILQKMLGDVFCFSGVAVESSQFQFNQIFGIFLQLLMYHLGMFNFLDFLLEGE